MLMALKPGGRGLTVVGDDAQSIYSFRAATIRNILDFPGLLQPGRRHHHARSQLPLDTADPGSGKRRHRLARERYTKNLWTDGNRWSDQTRHRQGRDRAGELHRRPGACQSRDRMTLKQQAVLFARPSHSGSA